MKELELLGDFAFRRHRDLALENGVLTGLSYRVYSMDGERLMAVDFFDTVFRIAVFVAALFVLQLIGLLFSALLASARAHRTLRPIREMAEKTYELKRSLIPILARIFLRNLESPVTTRESDTVHSDTPHSRQGKLRREKKNMFILLKNSPGYVKFIDR